MVNPCVDLPELSLLITSDDGQEWTDRQLPDGFVPHDVIWAHDRFIAVGSHNLIGAVATSPDGVSWQLQIIEGSLPLYGVTWDAVRSQLIAVGEDGCIVRGLCSIVQRGIPTLSWWGALLIILLLATVGYRLVSPG